MPPAAITASRTGIVVALALVTLAFLWRQWSDWRAARGVSPVKMILLLSSIAFWWYCNNGVQNILVGIALFEVFHDVQYLSIVWIYNRTRVERDTSIRGFMRFVFRRSGALIGVYVGLVLAYGAIGLTQSAVTAEWIRYVLIGVVTASACWPTGTRWWWWSTTSTGPSRPCSTCSSRWPPWPGRRGSCWSRWPGPSCWSSGRAGRAGRASNRADGKGGGGSTAGSPGTA